MRWKDTDSWKKRFALLPISDMSGNWVWLEWYWIRKGSGYENISFSKEFPKW